MRVKTNTSCPTIPDDNMDVPSHVQIKRKDVISSQEIKDKFKNI